jgi:nitrate/nitrite transporter NarK
MKRMITRLKGVNWYALSAVMFTIAMFLLAAVGEDWSDTWAVVAAFTALVSAIFAVTDSLLGLIGGLSRIEEQLDELLQQRRQGR